MRISRKTPAGRQTTFNAVRDVFGNYNCVFYSNLGNTWPEFCVDFIENSKGEVFTVRGSRSEWERLHQQLQETFERVEKETKS